MLEKGSAFPNLGEKKHPKFHNHRDIFLQSDLVSIYSMRYRMCVMIVMLQVGCSLFVKNHFILE